MTERDFEIVEAWLREAMEYGEERHNEPYEKAIQALEEIQQYRAIGTIEEFKALKEKSVAKKPIKIGVHHQYKCPSCGSRVTKLIYGTEAEVMNTRKLVCQNCRQKLDWSE